jgi:predicted amidohydrolase YtcJ
LGTLLPEEMRQKAVHLALDIAAQHGITTIHAMEGGELFDNRDAILIHEMMPHLPLHVVLYWCTGNVKAAYRLGLSRVGGDICLDGSIGSRTAAFADDYADDPGNRGQLLMGQSEIDRMVSTAHRYGMQIGLHAIGECAIGTAIRAIQRSSGGACDHRHRIEHFGVPTKRHIEQAARLGIAVATQPAFPFLRGGPGKIYEQRLGPARDRRAYPLRELVEANILVAGGSDSNVTPADPLLGIHSCVNHPHPDQRLNAHQALCLFTLNGARIAFEENERGSIVDGKVADCVVLDRDPLRTDSEELKEIKVLMTVSRGSVVFRTDSMNQEPHNEFTSF